MYEKLTTSLKQSGLLSQLFDGNFGIEIEEHRVQTGRKSLSQHVHPVALGDRRIQPYFQTDFSESQEELVTAPQSSIDKALRNLRELENILNGQLADDEVIWPLSMPPHLAPDDVTFLEEHFERYWYQDYRDVLLEHYGPYQHIMAGIHLNFSLPDSLIEWYEKEHHFSRAADAKNEVYFQIAQNVVAYRWLLTYLFGAAPISENEGDTLPANHADYEPVRSWRSSRFGFANRDNIHVDFNSFDEHFTQLEKHLANKDLFALSEYYGPVRFKGSDDYAGFKKNGTAYLEFRIFDLNPFADDGLDDKTMNIWHLLILDGLLNEKKWQPNELKKFAKWNEELALAHPDLPLNAEQEQAAQMLIQQLEGIVALAPADQTASLQAALSYLKEAVANPKETIAFHLSKEIRNDSLSDFAFARGKVVKAARDSEKIDFSLAPAELWPSYVQALELGLKVAFKSDALVITKGNQSWTITENTDLSQLI